MSWPTAFCGATGEQELVDEIVAWKRRGRSGRSGRSIPQKDEAVVVKLVVCLRPESCAQTPKTDGSVIHCTRYYGPNRSYSTGES